MLDNNASWVRNSRDRDGLGGERVGNGRVHWLGCRDSVGDAARCLSVQEFRRVHIMAH